MDSTETVRCSLRRNLVIELAENVLHQILHYPVKEILLVDPVPFDNTIRLDNHAR